MSPELHTVFEAPEKSIFFALLGLISVLIGAYYLFFAPDKAQRSFPVIKKTRESLRFLEIGLGFVLFVALMISVGTLSEFLMIKVALKNNKYDVVEGVVTNFVPMPYNGHAEESFEVNAVKFSYSDFGPTNGFNNTASHGGPIHEGLYVRVSYIGNTIIKLEVANNDSTK